MSFSVLSIAALRLGKVRNSHFGLNYLVKIKSHFNTQLWEAKIAGVIIILPIVGLIN